MAVIGRERRQYCSKLSLSVNDNSSAIEDALLISTISLSSILVIVAVGTYFLGFLFKNQIVLRALVTTGSGFYGAYYWVAGSSPLWEAIAGSILIGVASFQGMLQLLWSRLAIAAPHGTRHILEKMGDIEPGLFRKLIKAGRLFFPEENIILTRESMAPDALWYIVKGTVIVEKGGHFAVTIDDGCFIGEIAWLRGGVASATVIVEAGAEVVCWPKEHLQATLRRSHRLEIALHALIADDLAKKLASSAPRQRSERQ